MTRKIYFLKLNRNLSNPWGNFKGTWDLPDKISKQDAFLINGLAVDGLKLGKLVNAMLKRLSGVSYIFFFDIISGKTRTKEKSASATQSCG